MCMCVCERSQILDPVEVQSVSLPPSLRRRSLSSASLLGPVAAGLATATLVPLARNKAFPSKALRKCSSYQFGHHLFRSGEGEKRVFSLHPSLHLTLPNTSPEASTFSFCREWEGSPSWESHTRWLYLPHNPGQAKVELWGFAGRGRGRGR